jgi:transposase
LVVINEILNSQKYIEIIEEYLIPEINQLTIPIMFMQDNARPHTSKFTLNFMSDKNINLLNWPPQSPDMNPIENIWGIIKQKLNDDFPIPKNQNELIDFVFEIWDFLDPSLFQILAESVPDRLNNIKKKKGELLK